METETMKIVLMGDTGEANHTTFVLGGTGSGKTQLIANILKTDEQARRFLILDVKDEFDPTFFGGDCKKCNDLNTFVNLLNKGNEKIIYDLSGIADVDTQEENLNTVLLILCEFQLANKDLPSVTVVCDELNKFVESKHAGTGLKEIIQRGRGIKIGKIFGAQWFGTLPTWVRDSFSEMYIFRHNDKPGLQRLETYGANAETVAELPQYSVLYIGKGDTRIIRLKADEK